MFAVIFSAVLKPEANEEDYGKTIQRMRQLAEQLDGFISMQSVCEGESEITVSYWKSLDAIREWKANPEHQVAQVKGRKRWYKNYEVEIVEVTRSYSFSAENH